METLSALFAQLVAFTLLFIILSFAIGVLAGTTVGDKKLGEKIVKWEMKVLRKISLWIAKHLFRGLKHLFHYLERRCEPRRTPPTPPRRP